MFVATICDSARPKSNRRGISRDFGIAFTAFALWDGFSLYAAAVQAALIGNLRPMEGIALRALQRALRRSKAISEV